MKKYLIIIACFALLSFGCRVRKVAITKTDSVSFSHADVKSDEVISHIDTSKHIVKSSTVTTDSGTTTTTETGNFKDGKLNGPGTKTTTKSHHSKKTKVKSDVNVNGIIDHSELSKDSLVNDSTAFSKKVKNTSNNPDYSWFISIVYGICAVIVLIILIIGLNFLTNKKSNK